MIHLRRFTEEGVTEFHHLLDRAKDGEEVDFTKVVDDFRFTMLVSDEPVVDVRSFSNRREVAEYLFHLLQPYEGAVDDVARDTGLWAWLTAAYVDVVAPAGTGGKRAIGARPRYVPSEDYRWYYRHLLAGPYRIFRAHSYDPDLAMAVLATPVNAPGDVVENLVSRQWIVTNANLLRAITSLYYDEQTGSLKRGAARKDRGGSRRIWRVLEQFDLTYDIYGMASESILALLPPEFDEFKIGAA